MTTVSPPPASVPSGLATRVSLVYFAYFFFLGVNTPFSGPWLDSRGFGAWIGILLGASLIAKTAGQPTLSYFAELSGRRVMLILSAIAAVIATFAMVFTHNYFLLLTLLILAGFFIGPILPLTDAVALSDAQINYGRVRLWGSVGFAVANVACGAMLDNFAWLVGKLGVATSFGTNGKPYIVWLEVVSLVFLLAVTFTLPRRSHQSEAKRSPAAAAIANKMLGQFLTNPTTWLFMFSVATLNASHAYYYSYSVRLWTDVLGYSKLNASLLWAAGVMAEVALLGLVGDFISVKNAKRLMILAGIGGTIRWTLTSFAPSLWLLFPLQILHACTYAAMHLGAMLVLRRACPPQIATTVIGIYAALVNGVVIGIVTSQLDPVYALLGARGYLIMAALSALGGIGVALFARQWQGELFIPATVGADPLGVVPV